MAVSSSGFKGIRPVRAGWQRVVRSVTAGCVLATGVACDGGGEPQDTPALQEAQQEAIIGSRYQAESWSTTGTTGVFNEGGGEGQSVGGFQVNEQIRYASVNFSNANQIQVRLAAPYGGGKAELWADAVGTGTKLGTVNLDAATGSDWNVFATKTFSITPVSGTRALIIKGIATGGDWLFKLDWFELHGSSTEPPPTTPSGTIPVVVTNKCPYALNVTLTGVGSIPLEKDSAGNPLYRNLAKGASYTYATPANYPSGRVSAYKVIPTPQSPRELEKAEFTLEKPSSGTQLIHYNLTYVDHVGLPMEISSAGSGASCVAVRCNKSASAIQSAIDTQCPDGLRYSMGGGTICLAPRSFCLDGEYASDSRRGSICTRLDSEIARCASKYPGQCNPGTAKTAQVYACSPPFFNESAKWCSALNRGTLDMPDSTDVSKYYNTGKPYNTYAKWVHEQCGAVYSFAYDDYPMAANQAGFYTCTGGRQMNVTFCPAG
ncbi:beta-1,3-glucanase family protein [Stigmatella sp. ncwal1]|uniref:Beta-1,3-glucanase family protein n=1 Tax=Stigmatella ashevillensis TaxID=2995309 RepID=A0ABT5DBG7_9BACT|nr:beta-1,3-glucanase family protein [Stigmatella ashevillena]MDC0710148.1 beta-1,3-glucanase family protein [Stigmatella ashevillena]